MQMTGMNTTAPWDELEIKNGDEYRTSPRAKKLYRNMKIKLYVLFAACLAVWRNGVLTAGKGLASDAFAWIPGSRKNKNNN